MPRNRPFIYFILLKIICVIDEIDAFLGKKWQHSYVAARSSTHRRREVRTKSFLENLTSSQAHAAVTLSARGRQHRRAAVKKRSRNYWRVKKHMETEFRDFWLHRNVTIPENEPPPIPNESLLNYFERHDLRWAIVSQGGRESVSYRLNGAKILPGKWSEAISSFPELMEQLLSSSDGAAGCCLSKSDPPTSTKSKAKRKWAHNEKRKPKGYWDTFRVVEELCL
mmetsp:Transcript_48979/g.147529  ORF Transcript_48979/g.147529 Transcript_48979/m.147529 type:complete len:224 (-) Transcript_48979:941-1612(-)